MAEEQDDEYEASASAIAMTTDAGFWLELKKKFSEIGH